MITKLRNNSNLAIAKLTLGTIMLALAVSCSSDTQLQNDEISRRNSQMEDKTLKLWWDKGFNPEEDEALQKLVKNWEQETGNKVQIHFYTLDARVKKTQRYLQGGIAPDIFMSFKAESTLNPTLALENQLVDVTDIIEPVKDIYDPGALETAYYYNGVNRQQSYYAVPIHRAAVHIYYWQDLLEKTGRTAADIPQDWDGFWQFCLDVGHD